jgi:thymidylate synthase
MVSGIKTLAQNCHIYDRHFETANKILKSNSLRQPIVRLLDNKDFYSYSVNDFTFILPEEIKKLDNPIELAI